MSRWWKKAWTEVSDCFVFFFVKVWSEITVWYRSWSHAFKEGCHYNAGAKKSDRLKERSEYMAMYSVKVTKKKRVSQWRIRCESIYSHSGGKWKERLSFCLVEGDQRESAGWVLKQVRIPLEDLSAQSVLVVRLLLARAGNAILGLGGAWAQAVQSPTILCVINVVFKEKLTRKIRFQLDKQCTPAILTYLIPTKWFNNFLNVMFFLFKKKNKKNKKQDI